MTDSIKTFINTWLKHPELQNVPENTRAQTLVEALKARVSLQSDTGVDRTK